MLAIHAIEREILAFPTAESQDDKGIHHRLVSCDECGTEWRADGETLCPFCARGVGMGWVLDEDHTWDLMEAVSYLDVNATFDPETENETGEFRNLLEMHVPWYNMNCRQTIQACYAALCIREPHPCVTFAIAFFSVEYAEAPESEMSWNPDEVTYTEDKLYDLQTPPW